MAKPPDSSPSLGNVVSHLSQISLDNKQHVANRTKLAQNLGHFLTSFCNHFHERYGDQVLRQFTRKHYKLFAASKIFKNLPEFLTQIATEMDFGESCLVNTLVYIIRLHKNPEFVMNWFNVHRILLSCIYVADKVTNDNYASIQSYAWISGSTLKQMILMESDFLDIIKFDVCVLSDTYEKAASWLFAYNKELNLTQLHELISGLAATTCLIVKK